MITFISFEYTLYSHRNISKNLTILYVLQKTLFSQLIIFIIVQKYRMPHNDTVTTQPTYRKFQFISTLFNVLKMSMKKFNVHVIATSPRNLCNSLSAILDPTPPPSDQFSGIYEISNLLNNSWKIYYISMTKRIFFERWGTPKRYLI